MNKSENKPINKIVKGNIVLDVWLNEPEVDGQKVSIPNITIKRVYKHKITGQWKTSTSYGPKDLINIELAIAELKANPGAIKFDCP